MGSGEAIDEIMEGRPPSGTLSARRLLHSSSWGMRVTHQKGQPKAWHPCDGETGSAYGAAPAVVPHPRAHGIIRWFNQIVAKGERLMFLPDTRALTHPNPKIFLSISDSIALRVLAAGAPLTILIVVHSVKGQPI